MEEEEVEVMLLAMASLIYHRFSQVEYEDEKMQLKEVEKEIVTEVTMPRVKSLYRYKGQGMGFEKGEVRYYDKMLSMYTIDFG